ncbi:MAG: hypothetical protein SVY53_08555 [Chloroflexota bacterium]|nr:hypothetical protein [Chloroflexota bacterium]
MGDYYCTRQDLYAIGITHEKADLYLRATKELIDAYTEDEFLPTEGVKLFNGSDERFLYVKPRLRSLSKVEIYSSTGEWVEQDTDSYVWRKAYVEKLTYYEEPRMPDYVRPIKPRFPKGNENVRLTGTWGAASLPAMIQLIAISLAQHMDGAPDSAIVSERLGSYSVSYEQGGMRKGIPSNIARDLDEYCLHRWQGVNI